MFAKTQKMILDKMEQGVYPGVVYEMIHDKKKERGVYGDAAILPEKVPMKAELLFDVASLTKVVCTTTVLLKLWEAGRVDFDQPLQKYLPDFVNSKITLRHLLTHTADIETWIPNRDQLDSEGLRKAYLGLQNGKNIGREVKYTDAGTILLGFMLEEIYQKTVTEVFQTEVLTPLAMSNSSFTPAVEKTVPTQQQSDGSILRGITHDPKARVLGKHAGNAGLFTDLIDLEKFAGMYLDWGMVNGQPFLKKETIHYLLKDQTPTGNGQRSLGWDLKYMGENQHPILFHTGYTGTFLSVDPLEQTAFIFLSNRIHPNDFREDYIRERDEILAVYQKERLR